jgi:hypothetical protein
MGIVPQLRHDIRRSLCTNVGWEGSYRVRVSTGYRVAEIQGNCALIPKDLIIQPCISSDKSYIFRVDSVPPAAGAASSPPSHIIIQVTLSKTGPDVG